MLLILPPSETKRDGGLDGSSLDLARLGFSSLNPQRVEAARAVRTLSASVERSVRALKLGPTQRFEIDRNRQLLQSPVMAAVDRYTGVLYDALHADTLDIAARSFAGDHLLIGSALFGLLRSDDPIPAYRLSHDSRLPDLSLGRLWRAAVSAELAQRHGLVLDLRSEAYTALGRAPLRAESLYLRVVSEGPDGRRAALSHFNKHAKGEFTRRVLEAGVVHPNADSLIRWAGSNGIRLERGAAGELDLVV